MMIFHAFPLDDRGFLTCFLTSPFLLPIYVRVCFHGKKRPLFRLMRAAAPVIVSPFHISRIALVKTMLLALPTDVHFPRHCSRIAHR